MGKGKKKQRGDDWDVTRLSSKEACVVSLPPCAPILPPGAKRSKRLDGLASEVTTLLEDGESVVMEVVQRAAAGPGQRAQWEQRATSVRHEKPLVVQLCHLLLGFTRADTYFSSLDEGE